MLENSVKIFLETTSIYPGICDLYKPQRQHSRMRVWPVAPLPGITIPANSHCPVYSRKRDWIHACEQQLGTETSMHP